MESMKNQKGFNAIAALKIQRLLDAPSTVPLTHASAEPVWKYLEKRGLGSYRSYPEKLNQLRFNKECYYYEDGKLVDKFPTLLSPIVDHNGLIWSVHRTFLTADGEKAPVSAPKKMMTTAFQTKSAVIQFATQDSLVGPEIIGIAEGIETALSCQLALRIPTYSGVNANQLRRFIPPKGVKGVIIFADHDRNEVGLKAAYDLIDNLKELNIVAKFLMPKRPLDPQEKGEDWNDVLVKQGVFGFPNPHKVLDFMKTEIAKLSSAKDSESQTLKAVKPLGSEDPQFRLIA